MLFLLVLKSISTHIGIFTGDCCHNQFKHPLVSLMGHIHIVDFLCRFGTQSKGQSLGNAAVGIIGDVLGNLLDLLDGLNSIVNGIYSLSRFIRSIIISAILYSDFRP